MEKKKITRSLSTQPNLIFQQCLWTRKFFTSLTVIYQNIWKLRLSFSLVSRLLARVKWFILLRFFSSREICPLLKATSWAFQSSKSLAFGWNMPWFADVYSPTQRIFPNLTSFKCLLENTRHWGTFNILDIFG